MANDLDNWHQNALVVDVKVERDITLKQMRTPCPWCEHGYFSVLDRYTASMQGYTVCGHCGEFFGFEISGPDERSRSWRARVKIRTEVDLFPVKALH